MQNLGNVYFSCYMATHITHGCIKEEDWINITSDIATHEYYTKIEFFSLNLTIKLLMYHPNDTPTKHIQGYENGIRTIPRA